VAATSSRISWK